MRRFILRVGLSLLAVSTHSIGAPPLFSAMKPGDAITAPLRIIALPKIAPNQFALVAGEGGTVLQVSSAASASTVGIPLTAPAKSGARLEWRWKISNVLSGADMDKKTGDDYAARVYVFFDLPLSALSFGERTRIRLARTFWGEDIPTAVLCYVWDNRHPPGYARASPYTQRVRMIVLQSGAANVGKWMNESRDVAADFRNAFGIDAPAISGVAVGSDTDQTRETTQTWFGDVVLKP